MKYFVISQDGGHKFHTREVKNVSELFSELEEKKKRPHWHLSITEKGVIDANPAIPLYIYGAMSATLVIDEDKNILYSAWSGEHTDHWNQVYLMAFRPNQTA